MKKFFSIFLHLSIYAAIFGGILWGVPHYLSSKFKTEHPMAAITSGSMWPSLKTGDLVFIERVSKGDLKVGDIVVWQSATGFTIHRVVRLGDNSLTTKGDANFTEDAPVQYSAVVGRAHLKKDGEPLRIPYAGMLSSVGLALRTSAPWQPVVYERKE